VISIGILVALAAVSGFLLGQRRLRWFVMLAVGALLATLSAWVLQNMGFEAAIGIPVIVACLALYQGAYVLGLLADDGHSGSMRAQLSGAEPTGLVGPVSSFKESRRATRIYSGPPDPISRC
jgi:hypothetical protein